MRLHGVHRDNFSFTFYFISLLETRVSNSGRLWFRSLQEWNFALRHHVQAGFGAHRAFCSYVPGALFLQSTESSLTSDQCQGQDCVELNPHVYLGSQDVTLRNWNIFTLNCVRNDTSCRYLRRAPLYMGTDTYYMLVCPPGPCFSYFMGLILPLIRHRYEAVH
jgi:hypothetical protein